MGYRPVLEPLEDGRTGLMLIHDGGGRGMSAGLTAAELAELQLALDQYWLQVDVPKLRWVIRGASGHRFDDDGIAAEFTGATIRCYRGTGAAVVTLPDGTVFPFDERVQVLSCQLES